MIIERAAISARPEDVASKLARAPAWVRDRQAAPAPSRARRSSPTYLGWISGVACCGVSVPTYSPVDGRSLCEQFHPDGLQSMIDTAYRSATPVELQWGHDGPSIASTSGLDLTFRVHEYYGLCFDARVSDTALGREVLEHLERGLAGVSIGYAFSRHWHVDRPGVGTVRVVNRARLLHVALIKRGSNLKPAYPACYATAKRGQAVGPAASIRSAVESRAWEELKLQARQLA